MYNRIVPDASGNWSIPVEKIDGYTDMSDMFSGNAAGITTMDLSGWDVSNVTGITGMGWMFSGCTSLKTIRMVGCSEETINKVWEKMPSGCKIVTE